MRIIITILLAFLSLSFPALAGTPRDKIAIFIGTKSDLKDSIDSFIRREIKTLKDVEIIDRLSGDPKQREWVLFLGPRNISAGPITGVAIAYYIDLNLGRPKMVAGITFVCLEFGPLPTPSV